MRWATVMKNHVQSMLVEKNSESLFQNHFIPKIFLSLKDFIIEQKIILHHRIVFNFYSKISEFLGAWDLGFESQLC